MADIHQKTTCFHCGEICQGEVIHSHDHDFCCQGCSTVYSLLKETGLGSYYDIQSSPGSTVKSVRSGKDYLDLEEVKQQFIEFSEGNQNKVTFYLPAIHCSACIWLLEKLHKLHKGISRSEVQFLRKELTVFFDASLISLKDLVLLLEDLGYPPDLQRDRTRNGSRKNRNKLLLKLGVAGFCFGNIMLFSFPEYLSLDEASLESFKPLFGYLNLLLAMPVLLYADTDYLRSAWQSLRVRYLTIDVPIALGIITLFGRSAFEVVSGAGAGYFDSFAGLIFFMLLGKWYQSRTYEALAFDRDFKSYFPVAVSRIRDGQEEVCMLENIRPGDRLRILNNQVIPADAVLRSATASIDYSFVNGESDTVEKREGEILYAGGRQCSGVIEVEVVREVSQGYLTGLWNQNAFRKDENPRQFSTLIDKVSRYFSFAILAIAFGALFWWLYADPSQAVDAFTAVLIIACPCALALSMPFTSGNVSRILGKLGFFVKNSTTLERMAAVDTVVFDKTGTLTAGNRATVGFHGKTLSPREMVAIKSAVSASTHPLSIAIRNALPVTTLSADKYREFPGQGIEAEIAHRHIYLGSESFVFTHLPADEAIDAHTYIRAENPLNQSCVHVLLDGRYLGFFTIEKHIREGIPALISEIRGVAETHLLSGDNERARAQMEQLFGAGSTLRFHQSPMDKLNYIHDLQARGKHVMMLGDGLNDAGALKQADVGIAVADDVFSFSPACDAILQAGRLQYLGVFLAYIRKSMTVVRISVLISLLYNVVGLFFAVRAELTPLFAAILMPMSSVTVVGFVSLMTSLMRPRV